ncbi:isochorismatase family protein [Solwaraspora sp. WMMD791]|uniref:isochorismatase family protein n=1 Tax=Solwaraspora sp. WMMD791 TaxID=3016086 RepID=UPI00249BA709|nr:isochorismatase family protein [Solwaraspora sp. WMMD791]WFE26109.1 isochorismatase family protein [Solwaraspora sp. WMMD791]
MVGLQDIESYPLPTEEALPKNVVCWPLAPQRAVLLVHDMQRYFVGALPEPLRTDLVINAVRLRDRCVRLGVPVAYTAQPGGMSQQQRGLLHDFWGGGMRGEPAERDVVPELEPGVADRIFVKWRYSAFHRSGLLEWMRADGRDQIVLCGVFGHIGVLATAIDAFTNDIQPFVAADAIGDFTALHHRFALDYVAQRCGQVVVTERVFA